MKTKLLLCSILIFIICIGKAFPQKKYPYTLVDKHCKDCKEVKFKNDKGCDLKEIDKTGNETEIRLYHNNGWSHSITVLKSNKGEFKALYYEKMIEELATNWPDSSDNLKRRRKYSYKRFDITGLDVDSLIKVFMKIKVMELPSQNKLLPKSGYLTTFIVIAKVGSKTTTYNFGDPDKYTWSYPEISEFKNYKRIVSIFKALTSRFNETLQAIYSEQN